VSSPGPLLIYLPVLSTTLTLFAAFKAKPLTISILSYLAPREFMAFLNFLDLAASFLEFAL